MQADTYVYTDAELGALKTTIAEGNRAHGGLALVTAAYGLVGAIRLLEGTYLVLVTERSKLGTVAGALSLARPSPVFLSHS